MMRPATIVSVPLMAVLLAGGCYPEKSQSPTTGTLHVRIAESVAPPAIHEIDAFLDLYAERGAEISYEVVPSLEAVRAFVHDSIQLCIAVDSLTPAETQIVDAMAGSFLVRTAAYDGVAVVTHPSNPVDVLRTTALRDLLTGSLKRWEQIDGAGRRGEVRIVIQERGDIWRYLERTVLHGTPITAAIADVRTSMDVLTTVTADPRSIGCVGTAWLDSSEVRPHLVKLFMDHSDEEAWYTIAEEAREFAYDAHPANILRGYYPLRRNVYLLSRAAPGGDLATGLGAYVLNSAGQKIFFNAGLIPATQRIELR